MKKESVIKINVGLDENAHPEKLRWEAPDSGVEGLKESSAFMLMLWDPEQKNTLRIDLWTGKMTVEEMQFFMYESLASMADTYEKATSDSLNAKSLRDFARDFGKKLSVIR